MEKKEKLKRMCDYVAGENKRLKFTEGDQTLYPERDIAQEICAEGTWTGKAAEEHASAAKDDIAALKNKFVALHDTLKQQTSAAEAG